MTKKKKERKKENNRDGSFVVGDTGGAIKHHTCGWGKQFYQELWPGGTERQDNGEE